VDVEVTERIDESAMSDRGRGPLPWTPAEVYDQMFVPALFAQWGDIVAEAARLAPGQRVLDVACGTGILALAAAARVGPSGAVAALDANDGMLDVARRKSSAIDWRSGRAEALPFDNGSFDAVVSQFGMMFFDDPVAALREMMRVLRSGGRVTVAVWDAVDRSPGYSALAALLQRLFGERIADAFRAPFVLGHRQRLLSLCADAGIDRATVTPHNALVRFASVGALVTAERACVWTLGGLLDDGQFERLRAEAGVALRPFVQGDGTIAFDVPALIMSADKH
jgi:SAM-dependent methyltransferase